MLSKIAAETPLMFEMGDAGGWVIRAGFSKYLVAEGSGWSRPVGSALFAALRSAGGKFNGRTRNVRWTPEDEKIMADVLGRIKQLP
jgi:hypothetical protein